MSGGQGDAPVDFGALLADLRRYGRRAAALSHLTLRSAGELTELVAEMHHGISRTPLPFSRMRPDAEHAPLPYRIVRSSFKVTAESLAAIPATRELDEAQASDHWRLFRSIANGVMGDKLHDWHNALSVSLGLYDLDGHPLSIATEDERQRGSLVLFAHGLCLSEREWRNEEHLRFVGELQSEGHRIAYLRYNSGRAIHENGRALAELLHRHCTGKDRLILIGHSMGGLLFRSAFEVARQEQHGWLDRVTHAAFLGTPHHGSPLEKLGNLANALLGFSPYTLPLMRLGNIRSRGIKDLRYGCITAEDSAITDDRRHRDPRGPMTPLPKYLQALLVSAALQDPRGRWLLGDGLVPVDSARAEHEETALQLTGPRIEKAHIEPLSHMHLLSDSRVYAALREWLRRHR